MDNGTCKRNTFWDTCLTAPNLVHPLTGLRRLLYLVTPRETTFATVESVPNIIDESVPYFLLLIGLEYAILASKGKRRGMPLNDSLTSLGIGIISQLPLLFARSVEVSVYMWVHDNYRLLDIPFDSAWAWLATLIGVDFCFYWVHRSTHEINLIWSSHQVHHSSERYNLTTALRQSVLQRYFIWLVYAPLALWLPPSLFAAHLQLNLVYQFWIHTETIRKLPAPIEFVFNTPSHHRVHHGRNPYCIDKNYAGVFILFDRLFGTFQAERENEPPVFGLVSPVSTFGPLELQADHLKYLAWQLRQPECAGHRLRRALYGPSWQPGAPSRRGPGIYPEIEACVRPLNPSVPRWISAYATVHFIAALAGYGYLTAHRNTCSPLLMLLGCILIVFALSGVARLLEGGGTASAARFELARCSGTALVCALLHNRFPIVSHWMALLSVFYVATCCVWVTLIGQRR